MKRFSLLSLILSLPLMAVAQGADTQGIPAEDYYLMPAFGQGLVFFDGQAPARGMLNICALDNTVRFLDKEGKELAATGDEHIIQVQIDTVSFVRDGGVFYRLHPVSPGLQIAVRREVKLLQDTKKGAYGGDSRTSSIKEYTSIYADGVTVSLTGDRTYPYSVSESLYLFSGGRIYPLTKRGLRRCFPDRKADIDAWLMSHVLPETLPDARAMLLSVVL